MTMPEPTVSLSQDQIDQYREQGFLVVDQITTPEELAWMAGVFDRLFAEQAGRDEGNQFDLAGADNDDARASLPQILRPSHYAPQLVETVYRANVIHITRQLLGDDSDWVGDHMILKPAGYGAPTPWHQDEAYWNPALNYQRTNFWMPLQDATVESGCLHFLPGSHQLEVLEHQSIGGDVRVHGLELVEGQVDLSKAVACPIPAGAVTIHANRTLHYAGPNHTDQPRRAYIQGGGPPTTERSTPREFPWEKAKRTARQARAQTAKNG